MTEFTYFCVWEWNYTICAICLSTDVGVEQIRFKPQNLYMKSACFLLSPFSLLAFTPTISCPYLSLPLAMAHLQ